MWEEFKEFINRGNVIDLAVGVAIAGAFTAIVNSLVNDILMPLVGALLGGVDFATLSITVGDAVIAYGNFIQAIITFLIVALTLFLVVKGYNQMQRTMDEALGIEEEAAEEEVPAPTTEELLAEIRDLLKNQ